MSHAVQIQTEVRDPVAVRLACQRLKLPPPVQGTFEVFTTRVTGLAVMLPDWRFAVVCDTASGQLQYDNYEEKWGAQAELHKFLQAYACEKVLLEARRKGHAVTEQQLENGSIKLTVHVGGAA